MSDTTNDGGPAFPSDFVELPNSGFSKGMTLRDYFAAHAMQGWIAIAGRKMEGEKELFAKGESIARHAYECADAMLEARKREHK